MHTRTLNIISIAAATAGILATVAGLDAAIPKMILRGGLVMMFASCPLICASQTRRAAAVTPEQLAAAHADGYRTGLAHAALGLLTPPDGGADAPNSYARGHLRSISNTERTADQ